MTAERIVIRTLGVLAAVALAGCGTHPPADIREAPAIGSYQGFGAVERVTILGYDGDAMEPFITRDGRFLLFNNRNDPKIDTKLLVAERRDDVTFVYRGEVAGVNTKALEGVPSMDRRGNLYFVSTRSYDETLATLYRGRFADGGVTDVQLVDGVSQQERGRLVFDAEISEDGETLFLVDGRFRGGPVPESADLDIAVREGDGFRRLPSARAVLQHVNTEALEYAPAISADLRELFFTRLEGPARRPTTQILRAARPDASSTFGTPERIASISGFVEAPALSGDGRSLYFHRLEGARFVIARVAR